MILHRGTQTQQPQGVSQIDWANPITQGIKYYQTGIETSGFSKFGGVSKSITPGGPAQSFSSASSQYMTQDSNIGSGFPLTILSIASRRTTGSYNCLCSIGASTASSVELYWNNGTLALYSAQSGTTGVATASVSDTETGVFKTVIGVISAANDRRIYKNGVLQGANASAVSPTGLNKLAIGAWWSAGAVGGDYFNGDIVLTLIWNRALSDAEVKQISNNPWQIFRAPTKPIFLPTGTGTSGSVIWTESDDTYNLTGNTVPVYSGSVSWTESNDVMSIAGVTISSGAVTWTEANDTYNITGGVIAGSGGTIAWTDSNDTYNITSSIKYSGTIAYTESNDVYSLTGSSVSSATGTLTWVEEDDIYTLVGSSALAAVGIIAWTESDTFYMIGSGGTIIPPVGGISTDGGVSYVIPKRVVAGTGITTVETSSTVTINATGGGGSSVWGGITGTLSDQTDLQSALNNKADTSSIPAQFNPIAGTNMALSGTYPNITFNASGSGGGSTTVYNGNSVLDFGAAPGTNFITTTVVGQTLIQNTSKIKAYIMPTTTAEHNAYEHAIVPLNITCGNIVAGVGFDIYAVTDWRVTGTFNITWEWI